MASEISGFSNLSLEESSQSKKSEAFSNPTSPRMLEVIDEDRTSGDESMASSSTAASQSTSAKTRRANMVKKALTYFSDKSNRSVSEDNLFTRRKNLAVHLGLDDKVGIREVQKINTYCLPVPAAQLDEPPDPAAVAREVEIVTDDVKVKDLVKFLGIKDGITASMASQGSLSEDVTSEDTQQNQLQPPSHPQRRSKSFELQAKVLERSMTMECDASEAKFKKSKK